MKLFLNFFRQFDEVNFRDSRFRFDDDAIRIDTSHSGVFVFFAVNGFEIFGERGSYER